MQCISVVEGEIILGCLQDIVDLTCYGRVGQQSWRLSSGHELPLGWRKHAPPKASADPLCSRVSHVLSSGSATAIAHALSAGRILATWAAFKKCTLSEDSFGPAAIPASGKFTVDHQCTEDQSIANENCRCPSRISCLLVMCYHKPCCEPPRACET